MLEQIHDQDKEISEVWEQCKQFKYAQTTQNMLCVVFGEQSISNIRDKAPKTLSDESLKEQWPMFVAVGKKCKISLKNIRKAVKEMPEIQQKIEWLTADISEPLGVQATLIHFEMNQGDDAILVHSHASHTLDHYSFFAVVQLYRTVSL